MAPPFGAIVALIRNYGNDPGIRSAEIERKHVSVELNLFRRYSIQFIGYPNGS